MTNNDCEDVRIAAMAIADGEDSPLRREDIDLHLSGCEACRQEIEGLIAINQLFNSQQRLRPEVNVWPMVSERIRTPFRWRLLLLFGVPLFGYKFFVLILQASPSLWSKLVPVVLMIAIFSYLKVNPFKINSELTLKGEWSS